MRNLTIEMFKTNNNLNPPFLKEIFKREVNPRVRPNDIMIKTHNIAAYGEKSSIVLCPKTWNSLPENTKFESSCRRFKEYINTWFGPNCYCAYCK